MVSFRYLLLPRVPINKVKGTSKNALFFYDSRDNSVASQRLLLATPYSNPHVCHIHCGLTCGAFLLSQENYYF